MQEPQAFPLPSTPLRLLAIDDDAEWCTHLITAAYAIGAQAEAAYSLEEARVKMDEAEQQGRPYTVALVDMNFEMGKKRIDIPRGKEVVQYIKRHHSQVACIMVSGASLTPESVLDMRDDFGLDYYVQKDRFDIESFQRAINKALQRAQQFGQVAQGGRAPAADRAVAQHSGAAPIEPCGGTRTRSHEGHRC